MRMNVTGAVGVTAEDSVHSIKYNDHLAIQEEIWVLEIPPSAEIERTEKQGHAHRMSTIPTRPTA